MRICWDLREETQDLRTVLQKCEHTVTAKPEALRSCGDALQVPAVDTVAAKIRLPTANQMTAGTAIERPAGPPGEVDHGLEPISIYAEWAPDGVSTRPLATRLAFSRVTGHPGAFGTEYENYVTEK